MDADGLIWWSTPAATVGLVVVGGTVADCAPYAAKWARDRDARDLWRTGKRQGADLLWLPDVVETQVPFSDFVRIHGKVEVRRWHYGIGGGSSERRVNLGWLPDGRWYVDRTGDLCGWLYAGADQRKVRAAAEAKAAELRDGDGWRPSPVFEPGVAPPTPAVIVEWPTGFEPAEQAGDQVSLG